MLSSFSRWLNRILTTGILSLGGVAVLVGLSSGVGVWLFKRLIDLFHLVTFDGLGKWLAPLGG